jgi:uncharacterized SAM-binding protein YcdF (DUF218 family)
LFFLLSKTLGIMMLPTNFIIAVGLLGVALSATRWKARGRNLSALSVVTLALCGFSPIGNWLLYPLEQRFPPWDPARGVPDGIVVLGGGIDPDVSSERGATQFSGSAGRLITAALLAHQYPQARILYSGGNPSLLTENAASEADFAPEVFAGLGVPRARLLVERRSRNTHENAEFSKQLAAPKSGEHWLLVTSAYHMPRSVGSFRAAGFAVEPCPTDWLLGGPADLARFSVFASRGLGRTDLALREWMGLLAYRLTGKSSALFPAPAPD